MKAYHTVIVEDTPGHLAAIKNALARMFPEVVVVAEASSVPAAITEIRKHKPDFIILDVELDNGRLGFEVLDELTNMSFATLFVSAYNKYMRKAFLASAADFLEKSFTDEQFAEAIGNTFKALNTLSNINVQQQLDKILKYVEAPVILNAKLRLVNIEGVHPTPVNDIIYVEAQKSSTAFWLVTGKSVKVKGTLGDYEELLDRYNFIRVHRSFVVNLEHIETYRKKGHDLIMRYYPKLEIGITPEYRDEFNARYRDYTFGG